MRLSSLIRYIMIAVVYFFLYLFYMLTFFFSFRLSLYQYVVCYSFAYLYIHFGCLFIQLSYPQIPQSDFPSFLCIIHLFIKFLFFSLFYTFFIFLSFLFSLFFFLLFYILFTSLSIFSLFFFLFSSFLLPPQRPYLQRHWSYFLANDPLRVNKISNFNTIRTIFPWNLWTIVWIISILIRPN